MKRLAVCAALALPAYVCAQVPVPATAPSPSPSSAAPAAPPARAGALIPLTTVKAKVPDSACQQRLSGWVEMDFAVMPDGKVADIKVTGSEPRGVFEAAAVESLTGWAFAPSALPTKAHQRLAFGIADCRAEQLARQRTAGAEETKVDCAALASEGQAKGDPFESAEAPHRVIDRNGAQVFTAPDQACVIKGRVLGLRRPLTAYLEYKGFTFVADPHEGKEQGFWVWSNTLAEIGDSQ